jgi:hypothetical protein
LAFRPLQTAGGSSRVAATWWTTSSFTVDVNLTELRLEWHELDQNVT